MSPQKVLSNKKSMIKILVIQQKMIGDVLISTLICKNLKIWNPHIYICFVANRHTLDVIRNNPYIDEVVVFEDHFKKDKWGLFKFLLKQRKKKYDYIIDAYGKLESKLICLLVPAKHKIGFKKNYSSNQSFCHKNLKPTKYRRQTKYRLIFTKTTKINFFNNFIKNSYLKFFLNSCFILVWNLKFI